MARKFAERLEILLAVGRDMLVRTAEFRYELDSGNLADSHITDKIAKRLAEFPEKMLKEKDAGYEAFNTHANQVHDHWRPLYELVVSISEFRDAALGLLSEVSGIRRCLASVMMPGLCLPFCYGVRTDL